MTTERDPRTSIVLSWLGEDAHEDPKRMLLRALDEVDATPQRRSWWPAWRFPDMNAFAKVLVAMAAVVAVAVMGINLLPRNQSGPGGLSPSPSPSALPAASPSPSSVPPPSRTPAPTASLVAYTNKPFSPVGVDGEKNPRAASITFGFKAPPTWGRFEQLGVTSGWDTTPSGDDAFVGFYRGSGLYRDPCRTVKQETASVADIPVGPTVDDLVKALVDHPSLDVTDPVDVTLAGYSGKYLDLTIPDDISKCAQYRPMDGHHYAQGPGQRWHMWIVDVNGVRVLVETNDYPPAPPKQLAEEQAIIESLVITP